MGCWSYCYTNLQVCELKTGLVTPLHQSKMIEQDIFSQNTEEHIPIRKTLTSQELQIAVKYLKKRFPKHPIQHIVDSMNYHYELRKQRLSHPYNYDQPNSHPQREVAQEHLLIQPSAPKESREQKRIREKEELKMVSTFFCERGNDYGYAKKFMPDLTATAYKNKLVSIMGSVIKDLFAFIKKQCKTKPTELTENQIITIKSALISAHQWMGLKSTSAFSTFLNFITRKNVNRHKLITKEEAIQLYNVIAAHVNDTSLDLLFVQPGDQFGNQIQQKVRPSQREVRSFDSQKQVREIIAKTFLQYINIQKVSNFLLSKYGMDPRFDQDKINLSLKEIVETSITKINSSIARSNIVCSPSLMEQIFQEQNKNILYALVQVFLRKADDKNFYRQVMSQLQKLQHKANSTNMHNNPRELSEEQPLNHSQPDLYLEQSFQRQQQFADQEPKEMKMNRQSRYDTDSIFEEMFQVLLPKQNKSKSDRKSTTSSKRDGLAESVLYFEE